MIKLQIVSDLHLEFADTRIYNAGATDVLILSGDICVADYFKRNSPSPYVEVAKRFYNFFKDCCNEFPEVIYIAGNHEHYHGRIEDTIATLKNTLHEFDNLHILDNDYLDLLGHRFLGATLWTNVKDPIAEFTLKQSMNDYNCITTGKNYKINPSLTSQKHKETLKYFAENIVENTIIVGHHAPSYQSISEEYRGPSSHYLNFGYYTELTDFILDNPQIKLWTHGHVHSSHDYLIGDTRIVCNPRGYSRKSGVNENLNYQPEKVIQL